VNALTNSEDNNMLCTTLAQIKSASPCTEGYKKLLKFLPENFDKHEPIPFMAILDSNGLDDTLWALRTVESKVPTLFALRCAESVLHIYEEKYPTDKRVQGALAIAERYINGEATLEELEAAAEAAEAAAWAADAVWAARAAARAAAEAAWAADAARAAAWAAADAARAAAWAAADAARAAAWAAANAAARINQTNILRSILKDS
jgi:hypothetical protein